MVVNAPTSNVISAAELAIGLIFSTARFIPDANASLKSGEWKRSKFTGVELYEKTIAIIGLGRIGSLVAQRLAGFGAHLIGYDPYVTPARAEQMGVELVTLEDAMKRADFITIHIPKTPETTGLIGKKNSQSPSQTCASSMPHAAASSTKMPCTRRCQPSASPAPVSTCSSMNHQRVHRFST